MKEGDIDIIECWIEIGYLERMYYAQFGMFIIPLVEDEALKQLHGMTFLIPRINDDSYKCTPTPGQPFNNEWGDAPDWVLSQEGERGAKRTITPWPADCEFYPLSPKKDNDKRTKANTGLPIPEGCLISELANGQSGDQLSQPMARD